MHYTPINPIYTSLYNFPMLLSLPLPPTSLSLAPSLPHTFFGHFSLSLISRFILIPAHRPSLISLPSPSLYPNLSPSLSLPPVPPAHAAAGSHHGSEPRGLPDAQHGLPRHPTPPDGGTQHQRPPTQLHDPGVWGVPPGTG